MSPRPALIFSGAGSCAHHREVAEVALERLGPGGQLVCGKRCRQHTVHRGLARMHALEVTARHDPQPRRLGGARGDRVLDLLVAEAHRAGGRSRRADVTGRARDVPADVVVRLAGGVGDPGLRLEPEREARQGIAPGDRPGIGDGQDRRPHRAAAVHGRARRVVHVVEVEHMRGERVEEGRERR